MASGSVQDYLNYRGIVICAKVMGKYGQGPADRTGEILSEPDNGNGYDLIGHAHR